jgi:hypothetical protein
VDPYPEFYETIAEYARTAGARFFDLGLRSQTVRDYFANLARVSSRLSEIARAELAGLELTGEQIEFLRNAVYYGDGGSTGPFLTGWYVLIIYPGLVDPNGEAFDPTITDVHTGFKNSVIPAVLHVGVGYPNPLLISVKNEHGNRAYVGPAFSYHEFVEPSLRRWTDEEWKERLEAGGEAPRPEWVREFVR